MKFRHNPIISNTYHKFTKKSSLFFEFSDFVVFHCASLGDFAAFSSDNGPERRARVIGLRTVDSFGWIESKGGFMFLGITLHWWAAISGIVGIVLLIWESLSSLRAKHVQVHIDLGILELLSGVPQRPREPDVVAEELRQARADAYKNIKWHFIRSALTVVAVSASVILSALGSP
jgi:hypothetical protein